MAQGKLTYWWWLPALVCLLAASCLLAWSSVRGHSTSRPADVTQGSVLVVSASPAGATPMPLSLGMATDITDGLDPARAPGSAIAQTLRSSKLAVIRFGDRAADGYDWQNDCSYRDDGRFRECGNKTGQGSSFDRFLQFAGTVGARPLIVVNGEIDDPQQAARLVAYYRRHCVHALDPHGRPGSSCLQPYWEIGFSPATWKHFAVPLPDRRPSDASVIQPDQYAALVTSYVAAMRLQDPTVQSRIVADSWITGATDQSWIAHVGAIDTHYAPLLSSPGGKAVTATDIIKSVDGYYGRPSIDSWLQDLRNSLEQFSNSAGTGIIVGQWSIDANNNPSAEPDVYGGYVQALFAGEMLAHFWQDANPGGTNPLIMAIQYPIIGSSQEPFDPAGGQPRPALAVYRLVNSYFGTYPLPSTLGTLARAQGIVAASALVRPGLGSALLVNTDRAHAVSLTLDGMPDGPCRIWWIEQDGHGPAGVSGIHHAEVAGRRVTLPPWAVAVVQAGREQAGPG